MGSRAGAEKTAAARAGVTLDEYRRLVGVGLKRCWRCAQWRSCETEFDRDGSRADGKAAACKSCRRPDSGPVAAERRLRRRQGLEWCSGCSNWMPAHLAHAGLCRTCRNERGRQRYADDPEHRHRVRTRVLMRRRGVEDVPPRAAEGILEDFDGLCAYCDAPATTWDHIVPVSAGGRTVPGNVVPACKRCNSSKNNRDVAEWIAQRGAKVKEPFLDALALAECWPF